MRLSTFTETILVAGAGLAVACSGAQTKGLQAPNSLKQLGVTSEGLGPEGMVKCAPIVDGDVSKATNLAVEKASKGLREYCRALGVILPDNLPIEHVDTAADSTQVCAEYGRFKQPCGE